MNNTHTYYDYEEALYHMRYNECISIAKQLLPKLKDKKSKQLLKKLNKLEYRWNLPKDKMSLLLDTLWDIKVWLMVWDNWL